MQACSQAKQATATKLPTTSSASFINFPNRTSSSIKKFCEAIHLALSSQSTVRLLELEARMEAFAAFSLVAGILQVLDVSFRAFAGCREIYKDGSVAAHRDTGEITEALGTSVKCYVIPVSRTLHPLPDNIHWVVSRLAKKALTKNSAGHQ